MPARNVRQSVARKLFWRPVSVVPLRNNRCDGVPEAISVIFHGVPRSRSPRGSDVSICCSSCLGTGSGRRDRRRRHRLVGRDRARGAGDGGERQRSTAKTLVGTNHADQAGGRLDVNASASDQIFARYSFSGGNNINPVRARTTSRRTRSTWARNTVRRCSTRGTGSWRVSRGSPACARRRRRRSAPSSAAGRSTGSRRSTRGRRLPLAIRRTWRYKPTARRSPASRQAVRISSAIRTTGRTPSISGFRVRRSSVSTRSRKRDSSATRRGTSRARTATSRSIDVADAQIALEEFCN